MATVDASERRRACVLAIIVLLASIAASAWVNSRPLGPRGDQFGKLPFSIHDEQSYLFQAQTYLHGRLSNPSHPQLPQLFDQMHVLNEGRFASRYFPGTGAWIAPFLAMGLPIAGHWIAGALAAVFVFLAGRELGGNGVGFLAGLLAAISPGLALFSNLLLAHHPTLLGLAVFLWAFLRMLRTGGTGNALVAGAALSFAMLCRPMTAAGFALPCGIWFVSRAGRDLLREDQRAAAIRRTAALGGPLLAGMALQLFVNQAVTGHALTSPYQLYTNVYTPRHRYGFDNRVIGEQHLGPKVLSHYDEAAINLTPEVAASNVRRRLFASWQWTLGIVPLVAAGIVFVFLVPWTDPRWWLIPAGIVSLHAVHVPYWFAGMLEWHYVFETSILWLLIFAGASIEAIRAWSEQHRPAMTLWWGTLVATALSTAYVPLPALWPTNRLEAALSAIGGDRLKQQRFQDELQRTVSSRPALVLVESDPSDLHVDLVTNEPDLRADVLLGRWNPARADETAIRSAFPDRALYLYRMATGEWSRIDPR